MHTGILSRRDFLKMSGASLLALFLYELKPGKAMAAPTTIRGRVVYNSLILRNAPAFSGGRVKSYRRDTILEISEQVFGGVNSDYNRIWYRLGNEGYVYSGGVQPVSTMHNAAVKGIPETGVLGEIHSLCRFGLGDQPQPDPRTTAVLCQYPLDQCAGGG
jgi:hypothetical protein